MEITEREQEIFEILTNASNLCLVKATLDGQEVGVIGLINETKDGIFVKPIAIIVSEDMERKLQPDKENFMKNNNENFGSYQNLL